jgi:hypothetical protein
MNMKHSALVAFFAAITLACSGSDDPGGTAAGGAPSGGGAGGSGAGGSGAGGSATGGNGNAFNSFSVDIGPIDVSPGDERTQCVVKRLANPAGFKVGRIDNKISSSSHHLIVYRTNDTQERTTPFDCEPFVETLDPAKGSPLMITQKYDDFLQLPQGVGYSFDEGQMVRLELHYINTGQSAEQVTATSKFTGLPAGEFKHEADFLFIGDVDIAVAPNSSATVGPTFFALPKEFDGTNFFAITGHTHQFGTNVKIATTPDESGPDSMVYDVPGWRWDEPATVAHDPAFQLPSGGGFRFSCEYKNTSSKSVGFGESAGAEMCFFWAYYYPSKGARVCFQTDQYGPPITTCCPGGPYCDFLGQF